MRYGDIVAVGVSPKSLSAEQSVGFVAFHQHGVIVDVGGHPMSVPRPLLQVVREGNVRRGTTAGAAGADNVM